MRIEKDFLGQKEIEDDRYYGIHTARALDNFGISAEKTDPVFIRSYLLVKKACAITNISLGYLAKEKGNLILAAIDKILEEALFNSVLINPLSGGAGTSLNMNINEIIANYALESAGRSKGDYDFINPVDHVNMHQSTNDTFPSALKVAVLFYLIGLEKEINSFQETLQAKEKEFSGIIKLGRTEMQDALPVTVGMQFSAYSEAIARDRWRIFKSNERIKTLNLGGTAIGTGFNAPQQYIFKAINELKSLTNLNISRAENMIDSTQNLDTLVEISGMLKALAVNLMKISEDLRILSSGPEGGIGEFILPAMQEGSSIMPGKTNPVIPEFVTQLAILTIENDSALAHAAGRGNLELNQFFPLVAYLMLKNLSNMKLAVDALNNKAVKGLKINQSKITSNLNNSMAILTYLSQFIGHEKASELYLKHKSTGKNVKELVIESGYLKTAEYEELVKPEKMTMVGLK